MEELLLKLIGLQDYKIAKFQLDEKERRITLFLNKTARTFMCGQCQSIYESAYDCRWTECRSLSIFDHQVYLHYPRYRVKCHRCQGVKSEFVHFVDMKSKYAHHYKEHVGRLCREMNNSSVARLEGIPDQQVYRFDFEALSREYKNYKPKEGVEFVAVDEVYFRKIKKVNRDRCFVTNLLDIRTRKVVENAQGRNKASLDEIFVKMGQELCEKIKVIAADMHDPFWASIQEHLPEAKGVLDRFHIIRQANEGLNEVRKLQLKSLNETLSKDDKKAMHSKNRWIMMRSPSKRSGEDRKFIKEMEAINKPLYQATLLVEKLHDVFNAEDVEEAKKLWLEWKMSVYETRLEPFITLLKSLERKIDLLWNYFKYRVSTSVIEGVNNKIKVIKRSAYGYRNIFYFRLKILQRCGDLV